MKYFKIRFLFLLSCFLIVCSGTFAQKNQIEINALLDVEEKEINIQQKVLYKNNSSDTLQTIFFHNWPNSFSSKKTPLSDRLLEDYERKFYFATKSELGYTKINNISSDFMDLHWKEVKDNEDILEVSLPKPLLPNEEISIFFTYKVKLPDDKFTDYGWGRNKFNLRYWYLVPAIYENHDWILMNNLNMDDLYMDYADYIVNFTVPNAYNLNTDLNGTVEIKPEHTTYHLSGENRIDIQLNINLNQDYQEYHTDSVTVVTNLPSKLKDMQLKTSVLNRSISFLEEYLGKYPNDRMLLNKISYQKNPVYGFNQLPSFLTPFSNTFEWDIESFKILSKTYIQNTVLVNKREDYWLADGIQIYLMMEYINKFYPEIKAIGNISKIWGVRTFNISKLSFNDKYSFVYQFTIRKNLDQPLEMRADSLSNFNRKIVNKYKAGLGLRYLDNYIEKDIVKNSIQEYFEENYLKKSKTSDFKKLVLNRTDKKLDWFFKTYLETKEKIDFTIKKVKVVGDSLEVTIKNKRKFTAPLALYGVKNKEVKYKTWVTGVDSIKTVRIPKGDFDKIALNYEFLYPELNSRDNWKNIKPKLFNRPIKFRLFKDVEDPYYNEIFYRPNIKYNYYDGISLGASFSNGAILKKNFLYKFSPLYATKSNTLVGSASAIYQYYPEETNIYRYSFGVGGSSFNYAPELSYKKLTPFVNIELKRKSLRDVGSRNFYASYVIVDKERGPVLEDDPESYKYNVFSAGYSFSKPELIEDLRYNINFQLADNFAKTSLDLRYRFLSETNHYFDFRLYAGAFLKNNTHTDYFSFALDRPTDYLFQYNYFGRSESTGFFSQQYIPAEGGFKSKLEQNFANQWMATMNGSLGIWRWVEFYQDVGFLKNKNEKVFFAHDNGIRLNFIHNILEIYFPLYSNNGWEVAQHGYASRIRYVLTIRPNKIINFFRRGFY
ncbi:aminopeptidase [Aureivirga sp. CE67]|uniref:aminopeptidase n=1 Tax=Aureivirga sp. CE67 TaxID=1788983 RepID=UPI0018CB1591|nr:aminopeptidase [Aureivirga sp. CE67]